MHHVQLRDQIADEAARLLLRGKESSFAAARKRASRRYSDRKLSKEAIPSNAEIQHKLEAYTGLFAPERARDTQLQWHQWACDWLTRLHEFEPLVSAHSLTSAEALVFVVHVGSCEAVAQRLLELGVRRSRLRMTVDDCGAGWNIMTQADSPLEIWSQQHVVAEAWNLERLQSEQRLLERCATSDEPIPSFPAGEHPDLFSLLETLLQPLARVRLDPVTHPEGDALYHTLQVFELARAAIPYDEEFLLGALLIRVGWAINPRYPLAAALDALQGLISPRTQFFLEHLDEAKVYLRTGRVSKSLRGSPDFDALVLLARCERHGRQPGAATCTLSEAFDDLERLRDACG